MTGVRYKPSELPALREQLQRAYDARNSDERMAGGCGDYGISMLTTAIEVCEMGWECEETNQGLRVEAEPPVILATKTQKYRTVGKAKWEPYSHLGHVIPDRSSAANEERAA